ncbi:hypothetical protein [Micromonospora yasonensis]
MGEGHRTVTLHTGRGLAVAGLSCGGVGLLLSLLGLAIALVVQIT